MKNGDRVQIIKARQDWYRNTFKPRDYGSFTGILRDKGTQYTSIQFDGHSNGTTVYSADVELIKNQQLYFIYPKD